MSDDDDFSSALGPTTGEYRIKLERQERVTSSWKRWTAIVGAVGVAAATVLSLNQWGPCRSSWAFADKETNDKDHTEFKNELGVHAADIATVKTKVESTDKKTSRIQCVIEAETKDERRDCKRRFRTDP